MAAPSRRVIIYDDKGKLTMSGDFDRLLWLCGPSLALVQHNGVQKVKTRAADLIPIVEDSYGSGSGVITAMIKNNIPCFITADGVVHKMKGNVRIQGFNKELGVVVKTVRYTEFSGLIDKQGNELLPAVYRQISILDEKFVFVSDSLDRVGVMNIATRAFVIPIGEYESIMLLDCGNLIVHKKNGKVNMLDQKFQPIPGIDHNRVEFPGMHNSSYRKDMIVAYNRDNPEKKSFFDCQGKLIVPMEWYSIHPVTKNITLARKGPPGYESTLCFDDGRKMIPLPFGATSGLQPGGFLISGLTKKMDLLSRSYAGVIDTLGRTILEPAFDEVKVMESGFIVRLNSRFGFYNNKGKEILPATYPGLSLVGTKYILVSNVRGQSGFFTTKGKQITEIKYDQVYREASAQDFFKVRQGNRVFYVDGSGREYKEN
jgi:WG containing repeat